MIYYLNQILDRADTNTLRNAIKHPNEINSVLKYFSVPLTVINNEIKSHLLYDTLNFMYKVCLFHSTILQTNHIETLKLKNLKQ